MPQTISGATHLLETSQATPAQPSPRLMPAPVQVDIYADRLMNDLFEDVEDLLSGSIPPPEPIRVKPQPATTTIAPRIVAPLVTQPQLPQWSPPVSAPRTTPTAIKPRSNRLLKILTVLFGLSALSASSVWLIQRGTAQRLFAMATQEPPAIATATTAPPVNTTAKFAKYMQRSLENLDRKVASNQPGTTTTLFNGKLPTTSIPANPVTRPSSDKQPIVINVPSAPVSIPVATTPSKNSQELDQVLTRLSSVLERLSINPPARSSIPTPAPIAVQPAQAVVAEPQRTLRGIAIAHDPTQSAILFEMNGVTQRYYTGESIGSSGWSVVDISNNYVSVRRNGEVRSVSVGQKL
jgi:hypothetical protein